LGVVKKRSVTQKDFWGEVPKYKMHTGTLLGAVIILSKREGVGARKMKYRLIEEIKRLPIHAISCEGPISGMVKRGLLSLPTKTAEERGSERVQ